MGVDHKYRSERYFSDEKMLWGSFVGGDIDAYEKLFNLFYNDLYRYGLNLSHRHDLVRDNIHTLFVDMWERKVFLGEVKSVKAYFLASLRVILQQLLRAKKQSAISGTSLRAENLIRISIAAGL